MGEFRMPSLGADMAAGTLVEWLKQPGDHLRRGDIVAVVETQKGAIEVEVFEEGVLDRLLVDPGATVPVGTPLAIIAAKGEMPRATTEKVHAATVAAAIAPATALPSPRSIIERGPPRASPAARHLAQKRGIVLAGLVGTGPDGAIISTDVERAAAAPRALSSRTPDLAEMRRAIGAAMARSNREIPHYYLSTTVDLTGAITWLERRNAERAPAQRLLLAALQLKSVALALRAMPEFNGFFGTEGFQPVSGIHIGVAVAIRGGGLVAPALHDVDKLTLDDLMSQLRDLVARARSGGLRSSELADPTITVTNLGDRGVETVFGVIYPPQVALIGFGMPVERPWVVDDAVVARRILTVTLSADHRVSDGHRGALLLTDISRHLRNPEEL